MLRQRGGLQAIEARRLDQALGETARQAAELISATPDPVATVGRYLIMVACALQDHPAPRQKQVGAA